jgi:hypothetical protein
VERGIADFTILSNIKMGPHNFDSEPSKCVSRRKCQRTAEMASFSFNGRFLKKKQNLIQRQFDMEHKLPLLCISSSSKLEEKEMFKNHGSLI